MNYDIDVSKRLSRMSLNFEIGGYKFRTYWCRVVMNESNIFNDKEHSHSFFELHLCFKGESKFLIGGNEFILKKGTYILCDCRQKHTIVSMSPDFEKFVWGFNVSSETEGDAIAELSAEIRQKLFFEYGDEIESILSLLFNDVLQRQSDYRSTVKAKLYLLFMELFRSAVKRGRVKESAASREEHSARVIASYINDNILYGVAPEDLSKEFALCERQLSRLFERNYNISLSKYILMKKMEKAKELLEETEKSLSEISELLGYADAYTFGKAFKRHEGMSPGKFRSSIRM